MTNSDKKAPVELSETDLDGVAGGKSKPKGASSLLDAKRGKLGDLDKSHTGPIGAQSGTGSI